MAKIHLIAIGGSIMHNLALALQSVGHQVTGSDDQIFEPAKSRLKARNLLPDQNGWRPNLIHSGLEAIILGMHAKIDNPELIRAQQLNLPIYSFPEYVGRHYLNKTQIVVCGSHGKTTTSSMIMHILKCLGEDFDYLVGAQLEGFDTMVRLSDARMAVIEGDEYLSSCLDLRPKFVHYNPNIMILTGIAWDHYNVFPKYEDYLNAFEERIANLPPDAQLIYCKDDKEVMRLLENLELPLQLHPYSAIPARFDENCIYIEEENESYALNIFGEHNLQNLSAALIACNLMGIERTKALQAISSFKGAAKRLELMGTSGDQIFFRDFAHAPSKLKASIDALKNRYADKKLLAIAELHTFSSLNAAFIQHYLNTANSADRLIIYIDKKAMELKRMPLLSDLQIQSAFGHPNMKICMTTDDLVDSIQSELSGYQSVLFAGSGHFGGVDPGQYINQRIMS